jgi:hypothetical protein
MPLYLDVHYHVEGLTEEAIQAGHARDLAVAEKHGVRFVKYWYDESSGRVFCLVEAPSKEAFEATHREAHGILADEIWEVNEGE